MLLVALSLGLLGGPSQAQTRTSASQKAAAEALFDEGLAHLKANELKEACVKFEQSHGVDPAVGTLLYLAECYERTGRTASAWATFREAASLANTSGQADRAKVGEERASKLEARLAKVTISPGDNRSLEGFKLRRDKTDVPRALFDLPVPVDPGKHTLIASAPGYHDWSTEFELAPGQKELKITVPPLAEAPEPVAAAPVQDPPKPEEPPPAPTTSEPPNQPTTARDADHTLTWILGGVGVAAVGTGVYFGLNASDKDKEAKEFCIDERCFDEQGETLSDDAQTSALIANISYGVGGAAVLAALWFYFSAEPEELPTEGETEFSFSLSPDGTQLGLKGAF